MKKTFLLFVIGSYLISVQAQIVEDWTPGIPLTDSTSYNSNPMVTVFNDMDSQELIMFYEKRQTEDGLSTIWWRNLSVPGSEEQMFVGGWPEVDYKNPDVLFNFLIFSANPNGNYDLFGVKFDENGMAGNIFQITDTPQDEKSFSNLPTSIECCWERSGKILIGKIDFAGDSLYLDNIETIDSTNCSDPVRNPDFIAWSKLENDESHIYYSKLDWLNNTWSEPDTVIHTGDNTHLMISINAGSYEYDIGWQADDKIYFTFASSSIWISSPEINGVDKYYEPAAFNLIITSDDIPSLYAFAGETATSRDIYVVDDFISGYELNLTHDSIYNQNPEFFSGIGAGETYQIILTWQNLVNGYPVIYTSNAWYLFGGGIEEQTGVPVSVYPNPVGKGRIVYLEIPATIKIKAVELYNNKGSLVKKYLIEKNPAASIRIDPDLHPGLYYLNFSSSKGNFIKKIILQ